MEHQFSKTNHQKAVFCDQNTRKSQEITSGISPSIRPKTARTNSTSKATTGPESLTKRSRLMVRPPASMQPTSCPSLSTGYRWVISLNVWCSLGGVWNSENWIYLILYKMQINLSNKSIYLSVNCVYAFIGTCHEELLSYVFLPSKKWKSKKDRYLRAPLWECWRLQENC